MYTWSALTKGTDMSVVWNKRHLVGMLAQSLIEFALRSILLWEAVREGYFSSFDDFKQALHLIYMKNETMNSNSESLFITELSVVAKREVKTQDLRNHISFIFWWQWEKYGSRKGKIQNILQIRKNIQNRYLLDKLLLKSLSNRQNKFKSVTFYSFTEL